MERKEYLSPVVKVICLQTERILGGNSGGESVWTPAKGHNAYFDDWDDDEEDLTLPKSKSLWEDD